MTVLVDSSLMTKSLPPLQIDPDDLLAVFSAASDADCTALRKLGHKYVGVLADNQYLDLARELREVIRKKKAPLLATGDSESLPRDHVSRLPLLEVQDWPTDPCFLNDPKRQIIEQFIEEVRNIELLINEGVSSQSRLLLHGPPGTGKTHLAKHLAAQLQRQVYVARLDSLISSRLGETSKNIREIFDFIPQKQSILLLDEMDAIAKLRDDRQELGELKRVVNTVLQGLDSLSDEMVVIGATNHPQLLDSAIWRRFPYKLELETPDFGIRKEMWTHYLNTNIWGSDKLEILAYASDGLSGAEIELIAKATRRRAILGNTSPPLASIIMACQQVKDGGSPQIDLSELTTEKRKNVLKFLLLQGMTSNSMIAVALDVSRQMAHRYRKEFGRDR